jgi:hypothetical protein
MARKPVTIPVAADTKEVARNIKSGVVEPLEDMVDALTDVERQADDSGDALTDSMKDAQRATEKLEDEQENLKRTLEKGSAAGFKKLGDSADKNMDRAGQATEEFKNEATANIKEAASSFSGDMDSAIDLVQGTLGGLAGSIPGVGFALAGLGAAAGLFYNQWKEKTEAAKQRVQEMYDDMLASQTVFLSKEYIQDQISLIVTGADGAAVSMKNLQRIADDTGISQADLLLAFGGDLKTRNRLIGDLEGQIVDLQGATERAGEGVESSADRVSIASAQALRKLKAQNQEAGKATAAFQAQDTAISKLNATQGRTYDDMLRNQGEVYDSLGTIKDAVSQIPNDKAVAVKVNADTSKMKSQIEKAAKKVTITVPFKVGAYRPGSRFQ